MICNCLYLRADFINYNCLCLNVDLTNCSPSDDVQILSLGHRPEVATGHTPPFSLVNIALCMGHTWEFQTENHTEVRIKFKYRDLEYRTAIRALTKAVC